MQDKQMCQGRVRVGGMGRIGACSNRATEGKFCHVHSPERKARKAASRAPYVEAVEKAANALAKRRKLVTDARRALDNLLLSASDTDGEVLTRARTLRAALYNEEGAAVNHRAAMDEAAKAGVKLNRYERSVF